MKLKEFIKDKDLRHFFKVQMHVELETYKPGDPSMKPDVIEYMEKKKLERSFCIQFGNKQLYGDEIIQHMNQQQHYIKLLTEKISKLEQDLKHALNKY
jgi:HD superfamily phosphodiesterase